MMNKNKKRKPGKKGLSWAAVLMILVLLLAGCGQSSTVAHSSAQEAAANVAAIDRVVPLVRASFLNEEETPECIPSVTPSVESYTLDSDLENVTNADRFQFYLSNPEFKEKLVKNGFVVEHIHSAEFFSTYEMNRYQQIPNYVTVDSLMHTYHLAFAYLLRTTEKNYLFDEISTLSMSMLQEALDNYELLKGSEWEEAAATAVMFFAVGALLSGQNVSVPSELEAPIRSETDLIMDASEATVSSVFAEPLDYTQFKPRGYYEGDSILELYFRTMMWYGLTAFPTKDSAGEYENLTRAAVLITLSLNDSNLESWDKVYTVTSFFGGASDDLTYYELRPAIDSIYGADVSVSDLVGDEKKWNAFYDLTDTLRAPAINSMITISDEQEEAQKEFRFMGQRYTIDAEMMQNLIYDKVDSNPDGDKRMLPDTLDVPASMGSDTAVSILDEQGDTAYSGYMNNLSLLREKFSDEENPIWTASLYSFWMHTLSPIIREKKEGYPSYMQNEEWAKKELETFAGSYAELKHDTVLYNKQVIAAEMGGGSGEVIDDRGYVEPESEVYARFVELSQKTADGLKRYGMLSSESEEDLNILTELGKSSPSATIIILFRLILNLPFFQVMM